MLNDLFVVILNWNGWEDTRSCLESIKNKGYKIILVDNGSKNKEIVAIESYFEQNFNTYCSHNREFYESFDSNNVNKSAILNSEIILIKNNVNLGFAAGNNVGLRFVQALGGRYALLLNNDTVVEDDGLKKMFHTMLNEGNCGAVIPQIRYFDPSDVIWNCGGTINQLGIRKYKYAFSNINDVPQKGVEKVDYGTGCALLIDLQKTGILSEKYFFGEEDLEFAFRLKKRNLTILCDYESVIYHKVGASRNQISENAVGKMTYHYCQRISNLKDNLNIFYWISSVFLHMLSSCKLLFKMKKLNIKTVFRVWKEVLSNVSKEKFVLNDFVTISNKEY